MKNGAFPQPYFPKIRKWVEESFKIDYESDAAKYAYWLILAAHETLRVWETTEDRDFENTDGLLLFDAPRIELFLISDAAKREMLKGRKTERIRVPTFEWNPWAESRTVAERRIMAEIQQTVHARMDEIEKRLLKQGAKETPIKPAAREHLDWLVRYQVRGESLQRIATDVYRSRQAVAEGVHQVAEALGISVRPPSPSGRRRKSSVLPPVG